jgi:serine/threonine-protein kinase HipA
MAIGKKNIWVYAHWFGLFEPKLIGTLSAQQGKGRKSFSFEYNQNWLRSEKPVLLDPDISWGGGAQYPKGKDNFGMFMDTMPDTWGRTLMKRRAAQTAMEAGKPTPNLYDLDFLLGVNDESRMGALRFKLEQEGPFMNNDPYSPIPPWSSIRELQHASTALESDKDGKAIRKWLAILLAPGSSLGGARPKANIVDEQGHPWIAKFPSKNDVIDKGAWEYLVYKLALKAKIVMAESRMEKVTGNHHTFFTKRFDRLNGGRVHFASAMTMTGNNEDTIRDHPSSYLALAEFIQFSGVDIAENLQQLWRRIVFNIAVSNTDDHLRNHGFLLHKEGWILSPAYDMNPSIDKDGLSLNIDSENNALDFELAKTVGEYFALKPKQMEAIISEVKTSVKDWKKLAKGIGISREEQELMSGAFRI